MSCMYYLSMGESVIKFSYLIFLSYTRACVIDRPQESCGVCDTLEQLRGEHELPQGISHTVAINYGVHKKSFCNLGAGREPWHL